MRLTARINKLERSERARPPKPCPQCGVPSGWIPSHRVMNDDGITLDPTCSLCSFPVMDNGRAVCALPPGSAGTVLILDQLPPG